MEKIKTHKNMKAVGLRRGALIPVGGVLFTALAIFALFAACQNPATPASSATGRITVSFNIEGITPLPSALSLARTVTPDINDALSLLAKLELTFTPIKGGEAHAPVPVEVSLDIWTVSVELVPGTYTITATAYAEDGTNFLAAAEGSTSVQVVPNGNSGVLILMGPKTGSGIPNGTFRYDITISTAVDSATLTITNLNNTVVATKNLISDPSGTISLVPGYYYVNVSLTKGEDTAAFSQEALHIYTTVTSALPPKTYADSDFFEPEVVDDLSLDYWAFFTPEAGAEPWGFINAAQYTGDIEWNPVIAGGVFAVSTSYTATVTLAAKAGYTFNGITANSFTYTGAMSVTNPADSGVVTVVFPATGSTIKPGTLDVYLDFAGGDIPVFVSAEMEGIKYEEEWPSGVEFILPQGNYFYSSIQVRVQGYYKNIEWYFDGQLSASGDYYNLYPDNYTTKTHSLTVRGISWDGIPYSRILTITVVPEDYKWEDSAPPDPPGTAF